MLPIAGTDEELDLGEERLEVRDVWHGELHKSGATEGVMKHLSVKQEDRGTRFTSGII